MQVGEDCYFFMHGKCSNGDACTFRHCVAARDNRSPSVCSFWSKGKCTVEGCHFQHPTLPSHQEFPPASAVPCAYFASGQCRNGAACHYLHARAAPKKAKVCAYFASGECQNGDACQFQHTEEPPKKQQPKKRKVIELAAIKTRGSKAKVKVVKKAAPSSNNKPSKPNKPAQKRGREALQAAPASSTPVSFGVKPLSELKPSAAPEASSVPVTIAKSEPADDDDEELSI